MKTRLLYSALYTRSTAKTETARKTNQQKQFTSKLPKTVAKPWSLTPNAFANLHYWGVELIPLQRTANDGFGSDLQHLISRLSRLAARETAWNPLNQREFQGSLWWIKADVIWYDATTLGPHLIIFVAHFQVLKRAKRNCYAEVKNNPSELLVGWTDLLYCTGRKSSNLYHLVADLSAKC